MIIKKMYVLVGLFIVILGMNNVVLSTTNGSDNVIPNASYLIYSGVDANDSVPGIPCNSAGRHVTFYTIDGNPIIKREHNGCFSAMTGMLDSQAPKPQPVSCVIKYWPAFYVGFGMHKGCPGWFICFYDKNGNQIKSCRYDEESHTITVYRVEKTKEQDHPTKYALDESNPSSIDASFPLDLRCIKHVEKEPAPELASAHKHKDAFLCALGCACLLRSFR